jgi:hypothetical protein
MNPARNAKVNGGQRWNRTTDTGIFNPCELVFIRVDWYSDSRVKCIKTGIKRDDSVLLC